MLVELLEDSRRPIFINLASSILQEIERGRLKPGDALPGTRTLARSLKVHRNTVDAAYQDLIMQGWLVAEPSRGTFVARDLPDFKVASRGARIGPQEPLAKMVMARPSLHLSDGTPDARLMPHADLARAFRRALTAQVFLVGEPYGDPRGSLALRCALARYLTEERGVVASPDGVLVTRGSQMALFLVAAAVLEPGHTIAVEEPGYPLAWAAFRAAGVRVVGVPVDAQGLDIDRLTSMVKRESTL